MLKNIAVLALQDRPWLYRVQHDGSNPGRIVELDMSGKINGYNGEQESRWEIEDGILWFINVHGARSVRFDISYRSLGKLVIEGEFILNGLQVRLDEGQGIERISDIEAPHFAASKTTPFERTWVPYPSFNYGEDSLDGDGYSAPGFDLYQLSDVQFASRFGALVKDRRLVRETAFQHPFYLCHRLTEDKRGNYLYQTVPSATHIENTLYACGGIYSNYYHWLMFLMAKVRPEFAGDCKTLAISEPQTEFQRSGLQALATAYGFQPVHVSNNADLSVGNLAFPYQGGTTGVDPHPCVTETFSVLKQRLGDQPSPHRRIYISRSDTSQRRLVNEREIETALEERGFKIVSLTGMNLSEQISLFHNATDIVGPHGAGLTNVGFCQPGNRVLELQNPAHINWCMKKIAAISKLEYGHLMGESAGEGHSFKVNMAALLAAVDRMNSMSSH